jgi:ADP-ribose pyrophosphatase
MKLEEKTIHEEIIFSGRVITVRKDQVLLPNGHEGIREVVHHRGGVAVLAVVNEQVWMVEQFRYPYQEVLYELPAGKLEANEVPLSTGIRELEEETGLVTEHLTSLGYLYPSPGYCDEVIHLFYTESVQPGQAKLDFDEFLHAKAIPLATAYEWIKTGKIVDAKTIIALYKYRDIKNN